MPIIKTLKYFFEALFIYLFFLVAKLIGLSLSRRIFAQIFKKIGPAIKSKDIIDKNLRKFSRNISEDAKNIIKNNMWSNYGMTFIEYIFLNIFRKGSLHINIEGEEVLDEINAKNKTVIFISGHFANFELMSMEITKKKINLATIYRPLNNFFLNPFMEYLRKKYVCKNQIKKGRTGVKEAIAFIGKQHSIALMVDQRVSEGEKIKFFKEEALTTTLPAQLALKYNLDIVPIFIERDQNNLFKMKVLKPIDPSEFKNKLRISEKLNQIIESMIIKNPNQWIWTHDRWK
ncbi:lysophospholipid acyltransferase family protein [Pelagibacteraceae bacterium]|jgi:KDO2-lipid IV(A) lauroyltransferase|nr:lysophospholipid acyltransferase family protein [Pelagibacteraceae bacterium]